MTPVSFKLRRFVLPRDFQLVPDTSPPPDLKIGTRALVPPQLWPDAFPDLQTPAFPVTPPIPPNVATGDLITAVHENTVSLGINDLWIDLQWLANNVATNPTNAKGDLIVNDGTALNRLAVGTPDGQVLTVDAASPLGVKWAMPAAAGSAQTPWLSDIDAATFQLTNTRRIQITYQGGSIGQLVAGGAGQMRIESDPSKSFIATGDPLTLVGRGYIVFQTAAVERMRITASGLIGIGLTPTTYPLEVAGDVNLVGGVYRVNGAPLATGGGAQSPWLTDIDAAAHNLNNVGAIGIGGGSFASNAPLNITSKNGAGSNATIALSDSSGTVGPLIAIDSNFKIGKSGSAGPTAANTAYISTNDSFSIFVDYIGGAPSIRVDGTNGTGYVGIRKSSLPTYPLDVQGDCNLTGGVYRVNGVPISAGGGGSQTPWLSDIDAANKNLNNAAGIGIGGGPPSGGGIGVAGSLNLEWGMQMTQSNANRRAGFYFTNDKFDNFIAGLYGSAATITNQQRQAFLYSSNAIIFQVGGNIAGEAMRIAASGFVGIGRVPTTYPLEVAGDVNLTGGVYRVNGVPLATGGSQTPWTSDINAANFKLYSAAAVGVQNTLAAMPTPNTAGPQLVVGGAGGFSDITAASTATSANAIIGRMNFANYNTAGTDKRIAAIVAFTGATTDSGILSFFTYTAAASGIERMRISSSGCIGMGVIPDGNPRLDIICNAGFYAIRMSSGGGTTSNNCQIRWAGAKTAGDLWAVGTDLIGGNGGTELTFYSMATGPRMILTDTLAGVGGSPSYPWHINAATAQCVCSSLTGTNYARFQAANGGNTLQIGVEASVAGTVVQSDPAYSAFISSVNNYPLNFATQNAVRVTITGAGSMGVNTQQPAYPLDCAGAVGFAGTLFGNNKDAISTGDSYLRLNNSGQFTAGIWVGASHVMLYTGHLYVGSQGGGGNVDIFGAGDGVQRIVINGTANANSAFNTKGNIGINTVSPTGTLTVIAAANPTTVATATQLQVGEQSDNASYRLNVGYANLAGNWIGVMQSTAGGPTGPLALNPAGGYVGINLSTNLPAYPLDVSGGIRCGNIIGSSKMNLFGWSAGGLTGLANSDANILLYNASSVNWAGMGCDVNGHVWIRTGTSGTPDAHFVISNQGFLGVAYGIAASYWFQVGQDSCAKPGSNVWTVASDLRVKRNIQPFTDGLEKLLQLRPISFEYNGEAHTPEGLKSVGLIAQELEDVAPQFISRTRNKIAGEDVDLLSTNTGAVQYMILNALRQIDERLKKLES
jgi:hypothetical protein